MKDYYNDPKYKEFQDIIKQEEQKMENKCCSDLGNMFFQHLNQDNNKVYECSECEKDYVIIIKGKTIEIKRND